jgi:hypothetical protein
MQTHYDVLEVAMVASPETVAAAYRSLCKRYHPDINRDDALAADRMKQINTAYEILSDPVRRGLYDESLRMTSEPMEAESATFAPVVHRYAQRSKKQSPWETNLLLLGIRWVVFLPVGYALAVFLNILVLMGFTWMSRNDGRLLIKDIFDSGYPITGLFVSGLAAYGIATLVAFLCPKPKIGAPIYGTLYVLYAVYTLVNFYGQNNISKVVATVVVACLATGSVLGVTHVYEKEATAKK